MTQNHQPFEGLEAPLIWGFNDQGRRVKCGLVATFDVEHEGRNKHVAVYTDYTADPEGNLKIYAALYPDGVLLPENRIPPMDDLPDELWDAVQEVLKHVFPQADDPEY